MYQKEYMVINAKSIDTLRAQAYTGEYQNQAKLANSPATHDYRMWFTQSLLYRSTLFQNTDSLEKLYKLSMEELFSEEFKNLVIYDLKRDISGLYTSIDNVRNLGPIGTYDFFSSMVGSISAKYIPTFAPMNYDFTTDSSLHFNVSSEEKREAILNRKGPVGGGDPVYATKYIYTPLTIGELEAGPQPGAEYSSKRTEITEEYVPLSMSIIQKLVKYAETYSDNPDDSYVEPIFPGASEIYVREYSATKFRYLPLSSKEIAKGPVAGTTYYTKPVNTTANYVVAPYSDAYTCYIREYDNVVYTYSPLSCIDAAMGPKKNTQYFTKIRKLVENYTVAQLRGVPSDADELYYKELDQIAYKRVPLTPQEVAAGPVAGTVYSYEEAIPPSTVYDPADKYHDGTEYYEKDGVTGEYRITTNFTTGDDYVLINKSAKPYDNSFEYYVSDGSGGYRLGRKDPNTVKDVQVFLTSEDIAAGIQPGTVYMFPEILNTVEVEDKSGTPDPNIDYYEVSEEGTPTFVGKIAAFDPSKTYSYYELGETYVDITSVLEQYGGFVLDNSKLKKVVQKAVVDHSIVDFTVNPRYDVNTEPYDSNAQYFIEKDGVMKYATEADFDTPNTYIEVNKTNIKKPADGSTYYKLEDTAYVPCKLSDFDIVPVYVEVSSDTVEPSTTYYKLVDSNYVPCNPDTDFTKNEIVNYTEVSKGTETVDGGTEYYKDGSDSDKVLCNEADFDTLENESYNLVDQNAVTTPEEGVEYFTKSGESYSSAGTGGVDGLAAWASDTEYYTKSTTSTKTWKSDITYYTKSVSTERTFTPGTQYYIQQETELGWKNDMTYYVNGNITGFKPGVTYYLYRGYELGYKDDVEYFEVIHDVTMFKKDVEYYTARLVDNGKRIVDNDSLVAFVPSTTYYKKLIDYVASTRTSNYVRLETAKYDPLETYYTKTVTTIDTGEYEEFFGTVAFNPAVTYYTRVADLTNSTLSDRYTPYTGEYDPNKTYYKLEITETDSVYDVVSDAERAAGPVPGTVYYVKRVEVSESYEEVPQNEIAIHIAAGQTAAVTDSQPITYYTKVGNVYEVFSGTFDALMTYYTKEVTVKELDVYDTVGNIVAFEPNVTYYYEVSINDDGYVEKNNLAQFVSNKVYYIKTVDPNNSAMGENYVPYRGTTFNDYPEFYTKSIKIEEFDDYVGYVGLKEFNPHIIYFHRALDVDRTILSPDEINVIKKKHTIAKLNAYHDVYLRDALTTVKEIMSKHSLHVIISSVNMEADKYDRTIANEMYIKFLNVFTYLAVVIGHSKNLDDTCKGYKFINDMINVGLKHVKTIADMFSTANYVSKIVLEYLLPQSIKEAVFQHYDICSPVCDNISCSPHLTQSYVTENMVENMIKLRNLLDNVDISTETDDNALMGLFIMAYNIFVQLFFYSAFNSRNKVQIVKAVSTLFKTFTPSFDQVITAEEQKSFIELGDDK